LSFYLFGCSITKDAAAAELCFLSQKEEEGIVSRMGVGYRTI